MRVFIAACEHETNSFSPLATDFASFQDCLWRRPSRDGAQDESDLAEVIGYGAFLDAARAAGWEVCRGLATFAQPSAPASAQTWQAIKTAILDDLAEAGPLDAVLLSLHGAQMAQGCDDCEGDLLSAVRALVGPGPIIGVLLDLHGHVSKAMTEAADAIVACLEYPHIDFDLRARLLFEIVRRAVEGGERPFTAWARVPMIDMHHTTREPMRSLVAAARAAETGPVLAVSLMHGFPWADCADAGACVLVVADREPARAQSLADVLARRFFAQRGEVRARHVSLPAAIARAAAAPAGPVVMADASDNPGGGAASDSTFVLHALREARFEGAGVAIVWDRAAVAAAMAAGSGATIELSVGGKAGPFSGPPFEGAARVLAVAEDVVQGGPIERTGRPQGGALVEMDGVVIVLSGRRQQCVSPEAFSHFGFNPTALRLIVVKSMQHFHAAFAPIAAEIIYASPPGSLTFDFAALPYRKIPRPIWPLDPDLVFQGAAA